MAERNERDCSARDDGYAGGVPEYLARAAAAREAGDARLALHLYLAAFEQSSEADAPSEAAIGGLKQAWAMACASRERALAEYIFERLEPFLSHEETAACGQQLQRLALDKLAEFGVSAEEIDEVSEALARGFGELDGAPLVLPAPLAPAASGDASEEPAQEMAAEVLTYSTVAGYGDVIERMRSMGLGLAGDPDFQELVALLNARHGLGSAPPMDTLMFCCDAREDASRFMLATAGELGLPILRMRMEESFQGASMLCVSAQADSPDHLKALRQGFTEGGVLILEDLDMWAAPVADAVEDPYSFIMMNLSRAARETVGLIRQAVENPQVYVLASVSVPEAVDPFFLDLLAPFSCIDIDLPTEAERADVWMDIARSYPSLRSVNRADLVRYSAHMPRYDIYLAAREAVEEAYKQGLVSRRYLPVSRENIFDKLAAYQPLDSDEYRALENAVAADFSAGLEGLEDLLG